MARLGDDNLVRMSELARVSGVPAPTIKHYIREGLLPEPALRTSRNMAWYDVALVPRIQTIKALQRDHFLPLRVIREVLEGRRLGPDDQVTAEAIVKVLNEESGPTRVSRGHLLERGHLEDELDWLGGQGLVRPGVDDATGEEFYEAEDQALLELLRRARRDGITPEMMPITVLGPYFQAVQQLVRKELDMFRSGVVPRAGDDLRGLAEVAARVSEGLVVHLRRRALIPVLQEGLRRAGEED